MSAPTLDQSTQVSFPVLLRSQQKALKRYATLADIKHHKHLHTASSAGGGGGGQWHTHTLTRPKSLNLSLDSATNALSRHHHGNSDSNAARSRLTTMSSASCNTLLSPKQYSTESAHSYTGSDVSFGERQSAREVVYSGHFKAVHQSKWRIGVNPTTSTSPPGGPTCSCHTLPCPGQQNAYHQPATPEGLSWRRLHMSRAKLKATATTSELLSGFAMVAMVELQINEPTTVPEWLFVLFAVCTTVLVAVHIFALMISTYILPNIDAISKLDVCELVSESPHERMRGFIELAWAFSTVLGLFLFLVEIAILCWVKFWDYSFTAAIAATVIVIPVLVMFVAFAVHFYHSLVVYKCDTSVSDIQKLEDMKKELDQVASSPV